ncbi:hypothetical protein LVJ94_37935 [Pendulispora rubella]|uniref:Outer membrane lipoprotein BamD-like domain-containing protein n=1 Tax=Pendulispora rubella TaxID=2741070 RepID=A0ABZ2KX79_9BACT
MSHPNDPRRLKDETRDRLALALLASVRIDAPPEGARARAKAALGLGPSGFGLLKWLSLASLGAASIVLSVALSPREKVSSVEEEKVSLLEENADREDPIEEKVSSPPKEDASKKPDPAKKAPAKTERRSSLLEEMALLDAARASLAAHAPARALATLDDLEHRFPKTTFREEATVLRIEALHAAGDRTRAEALARAFLEAHPKSAYARRVRSLQP